MKLQSDNALFRRSPPPLLLMVDTKYILVYFVGLSLHKPTLYASLIKRAEREYIRGFLLFLSSGGLENWNSTLAEADDFHKYGQVCKLGNDQ